MLDIPMAELLSCSFIIIIIFFSLNCGYKTYKLCIRKSEDEKRRRDIEIMKKYDNMK